MPLRLAANSCRPRTPQRDHHAFFIPQLHACEAADQRAAGTNGIVATRSAKRFLQSRWWKQVLFCALRYCQH
jgi:hypothetical protein